MVRPPSLLPFAVGQLLSMRAAEAAVPSRHARAGCVAVALRVRDLGCSAACSMSCQIMYRQFVSRYSPKGSPQTMDLDMVEHRARSSSEVQFLFHQEIPSTDPQSIGTSISVRYSSGFVP